MNAVVLSKDLQDLVEAEVASGFAPDAQSVVDAAIRSHLQRLADLRRSLDEARADFVANGGIDLEDLREEFETRWKRDAV